jgi:flagellar motor switch protein FliN/FliY
MADPSQVPDQETAQEPLATSSPIPAGKGKNVDANSFPPPGPHDRTPTESATEESGARESKATAETHSDIDLLLSQAEEAIASVDTAAERPAEGALPFPLKELSGTPASTENATVDLIRDVELDLRIELGRTQMELEDVLKLGKGSVVTLEKLAGDPVDIYVNGRIIARGEVLVLNDNFCVRVAELVAGDAV